MANGDWTVPDPTVRSPAFSGPTDPQIFFTTDATAIPADLVAYYTSIGQTVIAALIFQRRVNQYNYLALTDDGVNANLVAGASLGLTGSVKQAWSIVSGAGSGNTGFFSVGGPAGASLALFLNVANDNGQDFGIAQNGILVSQPRGLVARAVAVANTAAIGAEAVVLTTPSFTAYQGRCYGAIAKYRSQSTVANEATFRLRLTNLAGAVILDDADTGFNAAVVVPGYFKMLRFNKTSADSAVTIVQTTAASAGTVTQTASTTSPRWLEIYDLGAASDYVSTPPI